MELMHTESEIMVRLLLRLGRQEADGRREANGRRGIVVLPIHDGVLAPVSKRDFVRQSMGGVAAEVLGFRLPVAEKEI